MISRNIEYLIQQNKKVYRQNLRALQDKFSALQDKEKELIQANRDLLDNLRKGIDKIKDQETLKLREAEAKDLMLYQDNTFHFRNQLVASFIIILLLIIITFFTNPMLFLTNINYKKKEIMRISWLLRKRLYWRV